MDKNSKLLPIGVPGEICVSGDGVSRGYLNREKLTNDKFVTNPFDKNKILYKSGDLGRWLSDGNIEYLGRIDNQVKIRGFRIETGEIENQLLNISGVKEAAVLKKIDNNGDGYLCGYITARKDFYVQYVKQELSKELPSYMIPKFLFQIDKMPLTQNGKLDRKALSQLKETVYNYNKYEAPRDDIEKILISVWEDVFNVKKIGINDNFFELGGDSIKAIQIVSRLQKFNLTVDVKQLLNKPVLSDVRKYVKKSYIEFDQEEVFGNVQLTPIQYEFFNTNRDVYDHFNHAVLLKSKVALKEQSIREVFEEIVKHHDALRMIFRVTDKKVTQINRKIDNKLIDLRVFDLKAYENYDLQMKKIADKLHKSINLKSGSLLKLAIFHTDKEDYLLIIVHHLVIDGVSWRIILEDLESALRQVEEGKAIELQSKTSSFKEWAAKLNDYANSSEMLEEQNYWNLLVNSNYQQLKTDHIVTTRKKVT